MKKTQKLKLSNGLPKGYDLALFIATAVLMVFGFMMVLSANMGQSVSGNVEGAVPFLSKKMIITIIKEIVFLGAGYTGMVFLARKFRMKWLEGNLFAGAILATMGLLLACLFPFFPSMGGAHAWIGIPQGNGYLVSLQPSEFAKIMCILIIAGFMADRKKRYRADRTFLLKPLLYIAIMVGIVIGPQGDFGSAAVIFVISCVCLLIPNHGNMNNLQIFLRVAFWCSLVLAGVVLFTDIGTDIVHELPLADYQIDRFLIQKDPFQDQYGSGYQLINGLIAMANGGLFGRGLGNSVRKYAKFPAADTDFISAIIIEELGFAGFLVVFAAYLVIIVQLLRYAQKIRSEKAKVILVGTAMYFLVHLILNIGGATGFIPLTGVPLLLISAGGSSTMASLCALGLSQAVISQYRRGVIQ